jgi:hypothetical protein
MKLEKEGLHKRITDTIADLKRLKKIKTDKDLEKKMRIKGFTRVEVQGIINNNKIFFDDHLLIDYFTIALSDVFQKNISLRWLRSGKGEAVDGYIYHEADRYIDNNFSAENTVFKIKDIRQAYIDGAQRTLEWISPDDI